MRISDWSSDVCSSDLELANKGEDGHVRQPSCCAAKLGAPTQPRIQRMEQMERGSTVWGRIAAIAFGIFSTVEMMLEWTFVVRAIRCVLRRHSTLRGQAT